MPRALLIDDEPPACDILRALLADFPDVKIAGEAGTLATARALLAGTDYDLVFLDIQLRGGTGFDLVPLVRSGARVIFVTAYDQHALRAFEVNALDYLLKPIAPERLAAALARLPAADAPSPAVSAPLLLDDRVHLKLGAGTERFVRVSDIRCITSEENYSAVHVGAPAERLLVRRTLQSWEAQLPPAHFVRVHRQTIVNVAHVLGLNRLTEDVYQLNLAGLPEPVPASRRYVQELRERLGPA
jgi:two-component system LytT family response regulator